MKVEQFHAKNQFIIYADDGAVFFQSYDSIIAKKKGDDITLDADRWDYSKTTGKYRNLFLREDINETRLKIRNGIYKLENLN